MSDTTTDVHCGPSPTPADYHPDPHPAAPRETRYELTTEAQRQALAKLQSTHSALMQRAQAMADSAHEGLTHGLELLLAGMGAETKGRGVRVEANALVLIELDAAASPASAHEH